MEAFYKQNAKEIQNKKIALSDRFRDEKGEVILWEIKPLLQKENEMILKKCRMMHQQNMYEQMILAESVVFPDLNSMELQNKYHVLGKDALLLEILTAGEYQKLKNMVEEL